MSVRLLGITDPCNEEEYAGIRERYCALCALKFVGSALTATRVCERVKVNLQNRDEEKKNPLVQQ